MDPVFTPGNHPHRRFRPSLRVLFFSILLLAVIPLGLTFLPRSVRSVTTRISDLYQYLREGNPRRCFLEPQHGPCQEEYVRWYFDPTDYTCKPFVWGGCDTSPIFKFESGCIDQHCEQYDYPGYNPLECTLVPEPGPCTNNRTAWYYDADENECKSAYWGGCGGVRPFSSKKLCKESCIVSPSPTPSNTPSQSPDPSTSSTPSPMASVSSSPSSTPTPTSSPIPTPSPSMPASGPSPEQCDALYQSTPTDFTKTFYPDDATDGYSSDIQGPVLGLHCFQHYCAEKQLVYLKTSGGSIVDTNQEVWTQWFSEEGPTNFGLCPENYVVTQMQIAGKLSDYQRLKCAKLANGVQTNNETSKFMNYFFSNEGDAEQLCPEGSYMNGLQCSGAYCDNLRLSCIETFCDTPAPTPSPAPTSSIDSCSALARSEPVGFTTNYLADQKDGFSEQLGTPMVGIRCYRDYCAEQSLLYLDIEEEMLTDDSFWMEWFNNVLPETSTVCPDGYVVSQIQLSGDLSGKVRINCSRLAPAYRTVADTSSFTDMSVSNEGTGEMSCKPGYVVNGLKCWGAYCDNLFLSCVAVYCDSTPEIPSPSPEPCGVLSASSPISVSPIFKTTQDNGYSEQFLSPLVGVDCFGDFCSEKALIFLNMGSVPKVFGSDYVWSHLFSEEGTNNFFVCPDGYLLSRWQVSGSYADNNMIKCSKLQTGFGTDNSTSAFLPTPVSDEGTTSLSCTEKGFYLNGIKCQDAFCDKIYLSCVKVHCYTPTPSPTPDPVDACTAIEEVPLTDFTKNFMPDVNDGYSEVLYPPAVGLKCFHYFCEQKSIVYLDIEPGKSIAADDFVWMGWFNEITSGSSSICPEGYIITQMQVSGTYSHYQRIRCSKLRPEVASLIETSSWLDHYFSEEGVGMMTCPKGTYLNGIACAGSYCDNVRLSCIKLYCGAPVASPTPIPLPESCRALTLLSPKDQTKNFLPDYEGGSSEEVQTATVGVRCYGAFCAERALVYILASDGPIVTDETQWTDWFSDEGSDNFGVCPPGYILTQMQVEGPYSDNTRLRCSKLGAGYDMDSTTSRFENAYFSDEGAGTGYCSDAGYVVNGLKCSGAYCDNLLLSCVKVYCV